MTTKFSMTRDINGYNGFGLISADDKYSMILATNVEQHFTVPGNFQNWLAVFAYAPGSSVWTAFNNTAAFPSGSVSSTTSELNPAGRQVKAGDVISLITNDSTNDQVGVMLYALQ